MKKTLITAAVFAITLTSAAAAHAQIYVSPQPVVIVHPQPVVYQQPAVVVQQPVPVPAPPSLFVRGTGFGFGLHANVAYAGENELMFYGGGGNLRFIGSPRFGLELSVEGRGSDDAVDVPISLSGLVFFNRRGHVQPYLLAGLNFDVYMPHENEVSLFYAGGHAGLGVEFLVGRRLGLTVEARSFLQGLTDADVEGELEYGVTFNTGFHLYFPRHLR